MDEAAPAPGAPKAAAVVTALGSETDVSVVYGYFCCLGVVIAAVWLLMGIADKNGR